MGSLLKQASRAVLHKAGGLDLLIRRNRDSIGIVTFHHFASDPASLEELDQRCLWMRQHFTPVTLDQIADGLDGKAVLPPNPIAITVDDGYRDFLVAHPIFKRHGFRATVFLVSDFLDGECWLWVDAVRYLLRHSPRQQVVIGSAGMVLPLMTVGDRVEGARILTGVAKRMPDDERRALVARMPELCGLELPVNAPDQFQALSWDEVRRLRDEGVYFGGHTRSHPILSRVEDAKRLANEVRQPKRRLIEEVGCCDHFCYPNGGPEDISEQAVREVEAAGYRTAVTTSVGLNARTAARYRLRRVSTETEGPRTYFYESLAGLHGRSIAANEY